jgi:Uncharacterised protein conserved in bacteria (DUF2336)
VTDVLVDRGDREVMHTLAGNGGAAFSNAGYSILVKRAEGDASLMEKLGHHAAGRVLRFWQVRQTVGAQSNG